MPELTRVTDSMGDHWTYAGISIYPSGDVYRVPRLWDLYFHGYVDAWRFPSLDAAVDAIRTHLRTEADGPLPGR